MTVSISHDHKCYLSFRYSWVLYLVNECFHPESEPMMIQKEKWLLYSVILYRCSWKEGNELSLSGSTESQPQQSQELFLSDSPKEAGQKKEEAEFPVWESSLQLCKRPYKSLASSSETPHWLQQRLKSVSILIKALLGFLLKTPQNSSELCPISLIIDETIANDNYRIQSRHKKMMA